jgi:hypothetical protein
MYKSRSRLIASDINNILNTVVSPYQTRNNLIIKRKQDYFCKSYFIRSAQLWNSLQSEFEQSAI